MKNPNCMVHNRDTILTIGFILRPGETHEDRYAPWIRRHRSCLCTEEDHEVTPCELEREKMNKLQNFVDGLFGGSVYIVKVTRCADFDGVTVELRK
jgi:hypothetical protein